MNYKRILRYCWNAYKYEGVDFSNLPIVILALNTDIDKNNVDHLILYYNIIACPDTKTADAIALGLRESGKFTSIKIYLTVEDVLANLNYKDRFTFQIAKGGAL